MSRSVRIIMLLVFALLAVMFAFRFKSEYDGYLKERASRAESPLVNSDPNSTGEVVPTPRSKNHFGWWGAGLVLSLLGLGSLTAMEVTQFVGNRAARAYYDDTQTGPADPDYEKAEEEVNKGNFLDAIRLMREYLAANPRRIFVTLRIAEIYEKDLGNPLAAALEYEEVLKQRLPAERWGWAAIHLCNLYTGKLHQPAKAIALLRQIEADYGNTAAAEKARLRLEQLVEQGVIEALPVPAEPAATSESTPPPPDPGPTLPPGFRPR